MVLDGGQRRFRCPLENGVRLEETIVGERPLARTAPKGGLEGGM